ncbi:hypothetical protein Hanom_Chr14g01268851 [Helianthus anomalus]
MTTPEELEPLFDYTRVQSLDLLYHDAGFFLFVVMMMMIALQSFLQNEGNHMCVMLKRCK